MFLLCLNLQTNQYYTLDCALLMILCTCKLLKRTIFQNGKGVNRDCCSAKGKRQTLYFVLSSSRLTAGKEGINRKMLRVGLGKEIFSALHGRSRKLEEKRLAGGKTSVAGQTGKFNKAIIPLYNVLFPEFLKNLFLQPNILFKSES